MTPEQIEELRADMAAGTRGPWRWSDKYPTEDGRRNWSLLGDKHGYGILCCDGEGNSPQGIGDPENARRIARVPTLEAEVLRLTEERAALAEELARMRGSLLRIGDKAFINAGEFARYVREEVETALSHTGMTGPRVTE
jgi:hypothetical protein